MEVGMNKRFLFLFFVFCFCVYGYESGVSFLKISPAYPVEASSLFFFLAQSCLS